MVPDIGGWSLTKLGDEVHLWEVINEVTKLNVTIGFENPDFT